VHTLVTVACFRRVWFGDYINAYMAVMDVKIFVSDGGLVLQKDVVVSAVDEGEMSP
jgi:hypothetical protein